MFKTSTSRILAVLTVICLIVSALGIMAMAENVVISVTGTDGNYYNAQYNAETPEVGGWMPVSIPEGAYSADPTSAAGAVGFCDNNAMNKSFPYELLATYMLGTEEQFPIKEFGSVTYYRRVANGGAFILNRGAKYELVFETVDGQKVSVTEDWYRAGMTSETATAFVTDIREAVAQIEGNPLLKSISIRPYASDGDLFVRSKGPHIKGSEYEVEVNLQATDEEGNPLFEEDGTTPIYVQATDEEGNLLFEADGTTPIYVKTTETRVGAGYQLYFLFKDFTFSEAAMPVEEELSSVKDTYNGTTVTEHNGKITGLDATKTYAYGPIYSNALTTVTGVTEITGLVGGVYEVRGAAEGLPNSAPVYVTVHKAHYTHNTISITGANKDWKLVDDGESGVSNSGTAKQSATPISGYWTSPLFDPYDNASGVTLTGSSTPAMLRGDFDNRAATYYIANNFNATEWYRRNQLKFVYTFTPEEQFYPKDQTIKVSMYHGGPQEFFIDGGLDAKGNQINNAVKKINYAVAVYTDGADADPYIITAAYTAHNAYQNLSFQTQDLPADELVTRIEFYNYWDVPTAEEAEFYSNASTYPRIYSFSTTMVERPEAPVLYVETAIDGYAIKGFSDSMKHAVSIDGEEFTAIDMGTTSYKVNEVGTYYFMTIDPATDAMSEVVAVEVKEAMPAVNGLKVDGMKITGIPTDTALEYAPVDIFGFGEWTDVPADTTEITVTTGLWAVRAKANEDYAEGLSTYLLVGETAMVPVYDNAETGLKDFNMSNAEGNSVASGWDPGYWTAGITVQETGHSNKHTATYASMQYNYTVPSDTETLHLWVKDKLRFNYANASDEIIPVGKLGSVKFKFSHAGGAIGYTLWEGIAKTDLIGTIRVYVAGSDVEYYEFPFKWVDNVTFTINFQEHLPADATGFVTGFSILPWGGSDPAWTAQDNVRDSDGAATTRWVVNYLYMYYFTELEPAEAPVLSVIGASANGYTVDGFDAALTYAISSDGGATYTSIGKGFTTYDLPTEGTFYFKVASSAASFESEAVSVTVEGAQEAVTGLEVDGLTITGLDADKSYEYAPVDIFGFGEWTDVPAEATELEVTAGLWVVRVKASGNFVAGVPQYVLVGNNAMNVMFYDATKGTMDAKTSETDGDNTTKGWYPGYWTSGLDTVRDHGSDALPTATYANMRIDYNIPWDSTAKMYEWAKNQLAFNYANTPAEIIPVSQLVSMKFAVKTGGYMASYNWEGKTTADFIGTVRVYVADSDVAYYEIPFNWNGTNSVGSADITLKFKDLLPANATGYVTGISILPWGGTPDGWEVQDKYKDSDPTVAWDGNWVMNYIRLYNFTQMLSAATPELKVTGAAKDGGYIVEGFNADVEYLMSTDGKNFTSIGSGIITYVLPTEGTYYFKVAATESNLESEVATVSVEGVQDAVTGLVYADGKITGLDSSKTYEYAQINALETVWTTVSEATEIEVGSGLWAVRLPADESHVAGAAQYVYVAGANAGSLTWARGTDLNDLGAWVYKTPASSWMANATIGAHASFAIQAGFTQTVENIKNAYYNYNLKDDEILPIQDVAPIKFEFGNGAGYNFDGPSIGKVRFYVAGGLKDYYDVEFPVGTLPVVAFVDVADVLPENENGYLTGITVWPMYEVISGKLIDGASANHQTYIFRLYDIYEVAGWTDSDGDATNDQKAQDRWRLDIKENAELEALELVAIENAYMAGYKVKLDPTKSYERYEYGDAASKWTAVPAGTEEYAIATGPVYIRLAATATAPASTAVKFNLKPLNPVFGTTTYSLWQSVKSTVAQQDNANYPGYWINYPDAFINNTVDQVNYQIGNKIILSDVYMRYTLTEDEKFNINDNPYLAINMAGSFSNTNIGYIADSVAKVNVWVEGEDNAYTYEQTWTSGRNTICVNLLNQFPEIAGKTVVAYEIIPYCNINTTLTAYGEANAYMYFHVYHAGFLDTAANAASIKNNVRVNTLTGIRAECDTIFGLGATPVESDFAVYEVYDDETEAQINYFDIVLPEGFGSEAGTYTVTIKSARGQETTVEVSIGLESIAIKTLPKTAYYDGDKVDLTGIELVAVLTNGDEVAIEKGYYATIETVDLDTTAITVVWGGKEVSFDITVEEVVLESIKINTWPDKETEGTYIEGDPVDFTGLTILAVYNNGATEVIELDKLEIVYDSEVMARGVELKISYAGFTLDKIYLNVNAKTISEVVVATPAEKLEYLTTEKLDTTGLTLTVNYEDGSSETITDLSECIITADLTVAGDATVSVIYEGVTVTYTVYVREVEYLYIEVDPDKMEYEIGEEFDGTGAEFYVGFTDQSEAIVTAEVLTFTYEPFTQEGEYEVIVTYGGVEADDPIIVTVVGGEEPEPVVLTGITVTAPTKTTYTVGDTLDTTGMVVTANYSDGTNADVTAEATVDVETLTTAGTVTVTVTYAEKTATFDVTVEAVPVVLESITVTAPTKTTYTVGDTLDTTGMVVTANYSDGTTADVTAEATVDVETLATAGTVTVTVTYAEKTATFDVTVEEKAEDNVIEGTEITWVIEADGTLRVSGTGEIPNYEKGAAPWYASRKQIYAIVVEEGITGIGDYAFYNLSRATTIDLADSVYHLGQFFIRDTGITEITFETAKEMEPFSLSTTPNLQTIIFSEDVKNFKGNIFGTGAYAHVIKAPTDSYVDHYVRHYSEKYTTSAAELTFESTGNAVYPVQHFSFAGDNVFYVIYQKVAGSNWALEVTGSGKMKNFPYISQKYINQLTPMYNIAEYTDNERIIMSLKVYDGVTTLGNYAFYKCNKATSLEFPDDITLIGAGSLWACAKITVINVPETVTKIGKNAFNGCQNLTTITIPDSVIEYGGNVFIKCNFELLTVYTNNEYVIECLRADYGETINIQPLQ